MNKRVLFIFAGRWLCFGTAAATRALSDSGVAAAAAAAKEPRDVFQAVTGLASF
jgi:hypothetical protein